MNDIKRYLSSFVRNQLTKSTFTTECQNEPQTHSPKKEKKLKKTPTSIAHQIWIQLLNLIFRTFNPLCSTKY